LAEYVEVEDPIQRLRELVRGTSIRLQAIEPGGWMDWAR
jgi:hypothetical protein